MIRRILFIFIVAVWILTLHSCRTTSSLDISSSKLDSVVTVRYVERIVQDTIIVPIPREHLAIVAESDTSVLHTSFAIATAYIDSLGRLHHEIENLVNTLPVVIDKVIVTKDSIVYRDRYIKNQSEKTIQRPSLRLRDGILAAVISLLVSFIIFLHLRSR